MHRRATAAIPQAALDGSLRDFRAPTGIDFIARTEPFFAWQDLRRTHGLWPYSRSTASAPGARCVAADDDGRSFSGVNFGSQDYLSLSSHPRIKAAAIAMTERYGVHSAGSAALIGNTAASVALESRLSDVLQGRHVVLYPTGWAAGYGAVQGLVRPDDHVVIDILAHSCLQSGTRAATQNIHPHAHLDLESIDRKLRQIRSTDARNGIMVVTESLFSMHSDRPDLPALRAMCDEYGASLLVDCAHDFGSMGEGGLGLVGDLGMLDGVDVLIGSFSKTFASNGGFVAVATRAAAEYLKFYSATQTFSNAMSPVQAAIVHQALDIATSAEGDLLRKDLATNVSLLRAQMKAAGFDVFGEASPIVPVGVGDEGLGRLVARAFGQQGGIANLVEYPAVPMGHSRFRFQVMAGHTGEDIEQVVAVLASAMAIGRKELSSERLAPPTGPSRLAGAA